jgi:UrcA family protein
MWLAGTSHLQQTYPKVKFDLRRFWPSHQPFRTRHTARAEPGLVTFNPKETVMVRKLIPTSLILLSLSIGSAFAGPLVQFGDLNMAKPTDTATLAERVHAAAATYCAPSYESRHLIAPAFSAAANTACIKQVSTLTLLEIQQMKGTSTLLAQR